MLGLVNFLCSAVLFLTVQFSNIVLAGSVSVTPTPMSTPNGINNGGGLNGPSCQQIAATNGAQLHDIDDCAGRTLVSCTAVCIYDPPKEIVDNPRLTDAWTALIEIRPRVERLIVDCSFNCQQVLRPLRLPDPQGANVGQDSTHCLIANQNLDYDQGCPDQTSIKSRIRRFFADDDASIGRIDGTRFPGEHSAEALAWCGANAGTPEAACADLPPANTRNFETPLPPIDHVQACACELPAANGLAPVPTIALAPRVTTPPPMLMLSPVDMGSPMPTMTATPAVPRNK